MHTSKPPDEKQPQGTQSQTAQGDGDPPKYVTEEQLNRAISARFGDFQKKIEKSLGETLGTALSAKLEEFKSTLGQAQQQQQGGQNGGDPKVDVENHPLVKGLLKRLDEQSKATEQIRAERDAEKAKARDTSLRTKLADELTKGGLDPRNVRLAVGVLVDAEKRVRFAADDTEDLVFKDASGDVDLGTGLKGWLKSDDAKIFMPPRGTQGSGDRRDGVRQPLNGQGQQVSAGRALLGLAMGAVQGGGQRE